MFETFRERLRNWYMVRRATRQLGELDDHLLADVGIGREEIHRRTREAALLPKRGR